METKPSVTIEVQWPGKSFGEARDYAARFGCIALKTKTKGFFTIVTDDPINLYWLGANIHNAVFNEIRKKLDIKIR